MGGQYRGIGPHFYRNLDADSRITVELPLREVASRVQDLNYGTQRFLSHLVDVRRELLAGRIASYRFAGKEDLARDIEREGDPLADGIEALLKEGLF